MPRQICVKALRELCLGNIADHIDMWHRVHAEDGLDREIDSKSARDLGVILLRTNRLTKQLLKFLVVPGFYQITAEMARLGGDDFIDFVCEKCSSIESADLNSGISKKCMEKVLRNYGSDLNLSIGLPAECMKKVVLTFGSNLRKLDLGGETNDEVLEAVGNHCRGLLRLTICTGDMSRQGLEKVFYTDAVDGGFRGLTDVSKSITYLDLLSYEDDDAVDCIAQLLRNCTNLRTVLHTAMYRSVVKVCRDKNPPMLKLKFLCLPLDGMQNYPSDTYHLLVKCLPEITSLSITHKLGVETPLSHLLSGFGKQLQVLRLHWSLPLECLRYVGMLCPNLEVFRLTVQEEYITKYDITIRDENWVLVPNPGFDPNFDFSDATEAFESSISENHLQSPEDLPWSRLESLSFEIPVRFGYIQHPDPRPVIEEILFASSQSLIKLKLIEVPFVDINEILIWALYEGCFDNLVYLTAPDDGLTLETLWELTYAPKIRRLHTRYSSSVNQDEDFREMRYMLRLDNLDIDL